MFRRTDISYRVVIGAALCVAVEACAPKQSWGYPARVDALTAARSIAAGCGLAGQVDFKVRNGTDLVISSLDPAAKYERVDCLLTRLRRPGHDLSFIGNEAAD